MLSISTSLLNTLKAPFYYRSHSQHEKMQCTLSMSHFTKYDNPDFLEWYGEELPNDEELLLDIFLRASNKEWIEKLEKNSKAPKEALAILESISEEKE